MSLINDALQRAKEVQQNNPSSAGSHLQFHPAEELAPARYRGTRLTLLVLGVALLVPAGFLLWMRLHPAPPAPPPSQPAVVANTVPAPAAAVPVPETPPAPTPAPTPKPTPVPVVESALPVLAKSNEGTSNDVLEVIAEPPRLRAAPLKLQGILFNSTRPSAIINGKTVFINTRLGEFRVTAITSESVTLAGDSGTKVLTLGQ